MFLPLPADVQDHGADPRLPPLHGVQHGVGTETISFLEISLSILWHEVAVTLLLKPMATEIKHTVHPIAQKFTECINSCLHLSQGQVQQGYDLEVKSPEDIGQDLNVCFWSFETNFTPVVVVPYEKSYFVCG